MLETYYSSGETITKAIACFPGIVLSTKWKSGQKSIDIGRGFHLLAKTHPLAILFRDEQGKSGYKGKNETLVLFNYDNEQKIEFYDDPLQKFLRLGLAVSIMEPHKVLPQGFAVLNDVNKDLKFYRPRNYLPADDYTTLSQEKRGVALRTITRALDVYDVIEAVLSKSENTKINDAVSYYTDYLRASDPKIELVLLTMILEVLFIEDDTSTELQTKLMTRLSQFLNPGAAAKKQRYELSEFIKDIYHIRSSVLHGSEYQKTLVRGAKKTGTTSKQYLSSHISKLDTVVMKVVLRILSSKDELTLMNKYPRKGDDEAVKKMYQSLMLG